jgi:membrane-associated phospholipid phosphatase
LGLALLCSVAASRAEEGINRRELTFTLDEPWVDGVITGVGLAWWGASEVLLRSELTPSSCKWCNPPAADSSVRNALRWSNTRAADKVSDVLAYGLVPVGAIGAYAIGAATDRQRSAGSRWSDLLLDVLIIVEATALAADANQFAKIWVGRARPSVHAAALQHTGAQVRSSDDNRSFYSAHTNTAMAISVSACTVASMRGYGWAPLLCTTLPTLALGAGYLRIASDNHYFTDVAFGALAGASFGFAVPYFMHGARARDSKPTARLGSYRPYITRVDGELRLGLVGEF